MTITQQGTPEAIRPLEWHTLEWSNTPDGQAAQQVPVQYYPNTEDPRILLLCGLGEGARELEDAVRYLGEQGLPVAGVEVTYSGGSPEDIKMTLGQALLTVTQDISHRTGCNAVPKRLHLIGNSGGGSEALLGAAIAAENSDSRFIGAIGVLNPAGFTRVFSSISKHGKRLRAFKERMMLNAAFESMTFPELTLDGVRRMNFALQQDNGPEIIRKLIQKGHEVRVFSGRQDPVFPPEEMRQTLSPAELEHILEEVPGHHGMLATETGKQQIAIVARWAMSTTVETQCMF